MRRAISILLAIFTLWSVTGLPVVAQDRIEVAQRRTTLFDLLFGNQNQQQAPTPPADVQGEQPKRTQTARPVLKPQKPTIEKAEGATRLAVFGDSLATDLSKALERYFAEDPNLAVLDFGIGSSGFVRADFFDWNKTLAEEIEKKSFDLAVVMIGINDRQTMKADGKSMKPLTEEWTAAYQARVAQFVQQLRSANIPVIWVGLPPMKSSSFSADMSQIGGVQRLAAFAGGAEFVDIYERFLDDEDKYSSYGPDLTGQKVLMRKSDGIHFATAGADKLAFYVTQALKLYYQGGTVRLAVGDPMAGTDGAAMIRPPFQGLGQMRLLEIAGPVLPLSAEADRASAMVEAVAQAPARGLDLAVMVKAPIGRADAFGAGYDPQAEAEAEAEQAAQ